MKRPLSRLSLLDKSAIDHRLRDLHRVERSALPQVVRHDPKMKPVFNGGVLANAADDRSRNRQRPRPE